LCKPASSVASQLRLLLCGYREGFMKAAGKTSTTSAGAEKQLEGFIGKFEPKNQALIRATRKALRRRLPAANELVYDNYNFFVIGYGPNERASDAVVSIAANAKGVGLCFIYGAKLPDPDGVLQGSGKQTRFVRLPTAKTLAEPAIVRLLDLAIARARVPFAAKRRGPTVIKSISKKQRPRR
jgi:hypothetical protein